MPVSTPAIGGGLTVGGRNAIWRIFYTFAS